MVERSPEKAGVGGSTPSLATILFNSLTIPIVHSQYGLQPTIPTNRVVNHIVRELAGAAFASSVFASFPNSFRIIHPWVSTFAGVMARA